jgi:D-alanine-D-alanine ligase
VLGCKGIVRIDFIIKKKKPYFLEINTFPGLAAISSIQRQLKVVDVSMKSFITSIIEDAFKYYKNKKVLEKVVA